MTIMRKEIVAAFANNTAIGAMVKELLRGPGAKLKINANKIPRMDFFGLQKSDPYLMIYEMKKGKKVFLGRTETIQNASDVQWKPLEISVKSLRTNLLFEVYDADENSKDDFICSFETRMKSIERGSVYECLPKKKTWMSKVFNFRQNKTPTIIVEDIEKSAPMAAKVAVLILITLIAVVKLCPDFFDFLKKGLLMIGTDGVTSSIVEDYNVIDKEKCLPLYLLPNDREKIFQNTMSFSDWKQLQTKPVKEVHDQDNVSKQKLYENV